MADTKIEWADKVWNPVTGCEKVSQGCKNCYAERLFGRFGARPFTEVQMHQGRLNDPSKWKKPKLIFVNSMSDLFHPDVNYDFLTMVFSVMAVENHHTYLILTKRPQRMFDFLTDPQSVENWKTCLSDRWPLPNVWLGVSVEDQETANERIPILLKTPAAVRWISAEPLLGPIDYETIDQITCSKMKTGLDWVVCGGESGPGARPMKEDWARSLKNQCAHANIPFFMKQGSQANWKNFKNFSSFPADLQIRQYPKIMQRSLYEKEVHQRESCRVRQLSFIEETPPDYESES